MTSYKDNIGVTIDRDIKQWLIEMSFNNKVSLSESVNNILRKSMEASESEWKEIRTIKCKCGAEYSEKLNACPNCEEIK